MVPKRKKSKIRRLSNYTKQEYTKVSLASWPFIEMYPRKDGIVRTVKVKTLNNELIRPSEKLCLLENNYE